MTFVANLRNETIEAFSAVGQQPGAYLLSSHRVTPSTLASAARVRQFDLPLFADNGTKPRIESILARFAGDAAALRSDVTQLRRQLGRVPRGGDVPVALRAWANSLAEEIVAAADEEADTIDGPALLDVQLSMDPTALIAEEDFATGCLIGLDLERELTGWRVSRIETRNRRSLRRWRRVVEALGGDSVVPIAVLSAMDFNSARAAGRLAADAGADDVAIGMAGIMRDPSAIDSFVIGSGLIRLARPAPRRYVRMAEICAGLALGFRERGRTMRSLHGLGLGSSAHFPIPALCLDEETEITTDATSPIHDAVRDLIFYDPENDGRRRSVFKIVDSILAGQDWPFLSPFTRDFRDLHGHDPDAALQAWSDAGQPEVDRPLLGAPLPLADHLPLFGLEPTERGRAASRVRIAHNHWVLARIATDLFPAQPGRRARARDTITRLLQDGSSVTKRGLEAALAVFDAAHPT